MAEPNNILLIQPPLTREAAFPLNLAYLVNPIRSLGFEPVGCDADLGEFHKSLPDAVNGRFAAAVISVQHFQLSDTASLVKRLKAIMPEAPVILAGPHPALFPKETLVVTGADLALRGDAEIIIEDALASLLENTTPPEGSAIMKDCEVEIIGEPRFETELDRFPFPDRSFVRIERYGHAYRSAIYPFAPAIMSRGCRSKCPHCPIPSLRPNGFLARSAGNMADEMEQLTAKHGIRDIHFEDDDFFADRDSLAGLCAELRSRKFPYAWEIVNGGRPEHVPLELLGEMADAGCRRISIGIEFVHGDGETALTPLGQAAGLIRNITATAHAAGIKVTGYITVGLPYTTIRDNRRMVNLSRKLGLDMLHYSPYCTLHGSHYFRESIISDMTPDEIDRLVHRTYRRFYLRPLQMAWLATELFREPALIRPMVAKALSDVMGRADEEYGERTS